ncbi:MAG: hypothetical protein ACQESP_03675 [Candidatus Muiribacteriota bacterium]
MEDLKKYKWLIIIGLGIAVPMIFYNYVLSGGDSGPSSSAARPSTSTQSTTPDRRDTTDRQPAARSSDDDDDDDTSDRRSRPSPSDRRSSRDKEFTGYEEIVPEIFATEEVQITKHKNVRNIFSDFKLSSQMERQARENIIKVESEVGQYEDIPSLSFDAKEYLSEVENYLRRGRSAFNNNKFLKSNILTQNALNELEKIERGDVVTGERRGPEVNFYYKGFIISGQDRIALLSKITADAAGRESVEFLRKRVGQKLLLSDGREYIIDSIGSDKLVIIDSKNDEVVRNISMDMSF